MDPFLVLDTYMDTKLDVCFFCLTSYIVKRCGEETGTTFLAWESEGPIFFPKIWVLGILGAKWTQKPVLSRRPQYSTFTG